MCIYAIMRRNLRDNLDNIHLKIRENQKSSIISDQQIVDYFMYCFHRSSINSHSSPSINDLLIDLSLDPSVGRIVSRIAVTHRRRWPYWKPRLYTSAWPFCEGLKPSL